MKLKKLLLASVAMAAFAPGAWAELPTDGEYLIQNVETGYYLGGGLDWGTHATLIGKPQWFALTKKSEGVYTLDSHQYNDATNHFLGTGLYVDAAASDWTFAENSDGTFTINNSGNYISGNGMNAAIATVTDATAASAQWKLVTKADVIASQENASYENPVDVTAFILDPEFKRNGSTSYYTVWTVTGFDGTGTPGNYSYGNNGNVASCAESYHSSNGFSLTQDITGLKAGYYKLGAHAFYREDGSQTVYPYIFANDNQATFPLKTGNESSMVTAYSSFLAGNYGVETDPVKIKDGETLTVGVKGAATDKWNIWGEFSLTYLGTSSPNEKLYNETLESAKAFVAENHAMNAEVLASLNNAIAEHGNLSDATDEEYTAAKAEIKTALSAAEASAEVYVSIASYTEEITANVAKLDDAGQAYYNENKTSVETKLSNKEYETYAEYESELKPIYIQAVKSQISLNSDWTGVIENADFKTNDLSAWNTNGLASPGLDTQNHDCEFYNTSFNLSQTISGMKKGTYEISLQAFQRLGGASADLMTAYNNGSWESVAELYTTAQTSNVKNICEYAQTTGVYLGSDGTSVFPYDSKITYNDTDYYIPNSMAGTRLWFDKTDENGVAFYTTTANAVVTEDGGDISFGFRGDVTGNSKWLIFDNFTLKYISENVLVDAAESEKLLAQLPATPYNAELKAKVDAAASDLQSDLTNGTYYAALQALIGDVTTSVSAYETAKATLDLRAEFVKTTNVYTSEAYDTYYTTPLANYENGAFTTDEAKAIVSPYADSKTGPVASFLLSAWDVTSLEDAYYINTWSTEGANDGSNFVTPFYEYWTYDDKTLGEKTLTATLNGLNAGQLYEVTAWSRVRLTNDATAAPYGISFQVGDGAAINVCDAEQIGTSQLYLQDTKAVGAADADGKLTIKYIVASDNNISWLAFKNVNYAEFTAPEAETRTSAENTFGTISLPYAFTAEGATLYTVDNIENNYVNLTEAESGAAGAAYIYQATANEQSFSYKEGALVSTPSTGILTGVFADTKATADTYVLQTQDGVQAFYKVAEGSEPTIGAYRAYLTYTPATEESTEESAAAIRISLNGEVTGIDAVNALTEGKAEIYDLSGRKLNKLQKGVNIVNGVKVIVK